MLTFYLFYALLIRVGYVCCMKIIILTSQKVVTLQKMVMSQKAVMSQMVVTSHVNVILHRFMYQRAVTSKRL